MKFFNRKNLFFVGLAFLFSLVSIPTFSNTIPPDAVKTTLVVARHQPNTKYSIHFSSVDKAIVVPVLAFLNHSFRTSKHYFEKAIQLHLKLSNVNPLL